MFWVSRGWGGVGSSEDFREFSVVALGGTLGFSEGVSEGFGRRFFGEVSVG